MASFKDLKNKLLKEDNIEETKKPEPKVLENIENNQFELEEARYMLNLIANSDFKGKDVQVVYNLAVKLQSIITKTIQE